MVNLAEPQHVAFQSKQQPVFTFRIFGTWPSKPSVTETAVSQLMGKPSKRWTSMKQLYLWIVSDYPKTGLNDHLNVWKIESLKGKDLAQECQICQTLICNDTKFRKCNHAVSTKRNKLSKLDSIEDAYDYGYKNPEFMLRVKFHFFF